jgi:hypothetical protein
MAEFKFQAIIYLFDQSKLTVKIYKPEEKVFQIFICSRTIYSIFGNILDGII